MAAAQAAVRSQRLGYTPAERECPCARLESIGDQRESHADWLGGRDSNPDSMVQSHVSYRWTTSQQDGAENVAKTALQVKSPGYGRAGASTGVTLSRIWPMRSTSWLRAAAASASRACSRASAGLLLAWSTPASAACA